MPFDMPSYILGKAAGGGGGSGGGTEAKQVNFIDYDGTILHAYTKEEANALTALPDNPTHDGLTAQGWNWTLAQVKAQLTACPDGDVWVGQMYITTSGATEIDITLEADALSPWLFIRPSGTVIIDWGDGSATDTVTGNGNNDQYTNHTYSSAGDYTVKLSASGASTFQIANGNSSYSGLLSIKNGGSESSVYSQAVKSVRLGNGATIKGYSFTNCINLSYVTVYSGSVNFSDGPFQQCYSLKSFTVPSDVTVLNGLYAFSKCYNLQSISLPPSLTKIGSNSFPYCYNIRYMTLPTSLTVIGSNAFQYCYNLSLTVPSSVATFGDGAFNSMHTMKTCTIPASMSGVPDSIFSGNYLESVVIPSGVTSIGNSAFSNCYFLTEINIPSSVTSIGTSAFYQCFNLTGITLPSGLTSLGPSSLSFCFSLKSVNIPTGITSIGNATFYSDKSLLSLTIPSGVTSIGKQAFSGCISLKEFHFKPTTPPTVDNSDAFSNLPTTCTIYVPTGYLSAYTSASNYPSSLTYTYVEE